MTWQAVVRLPDDASFARSPPLRILQSSMRRGRTARWAGAFAPRARVWTCPGPAGRPMGAWSCLRVS